MAKPKLEMLSVHPAINGGHTVRHEFAPRAQHTRGLAGGLGMERPPAEEHSFGPHEGHNLMQHIAGALALKNVLDARPQPGANQGRTQPPAPNTEEEEPE